MLNSTYEKVDTIMKRTETRNYDLRDSIGKRDDKNRTRKTYQDSNENEENKK